jgi:hypothetical protein
MLQRFSRFDVLGAKRNDRHVLVDCSLDFAHHVGRRIRAGGKHQREHAAAVDGVDQGFTIVAQTASAMVLTAVEQLMKTS